MSGFEDMQRMTLDLPHQLGEGFSLARSLPRVPFGQPTVIAGMGGSGMAGEIMSALALSAGVEPVFASRSFTLPHWAGKGTRAIFVSYSGDTAETLGAYEEGGRRGLSRAVVTSGGRLRAKAMSEGIPCAVVPAGRPPRASLGYLLGVLCGLLHDQYPPGTIDVGSTVSELARLSGPLAESGGTPSQVAEGWGDRRLHVYVPERLAPIGRRWKTQAEENAKQPGHFDTVPEMLHNAIVSWGTKPARDAKDSFAVLLTGPNDPPEICQRMDYMEETIQGNGGRSLRIRLTQRSLLTEFLEGIWIGDMATLLQARRLGIDPLPVEPIGRLKEHFPLR